MSVQKTAKAAEILGYHEDKKYYDGLYQKIREAIIREYFTETGRLAIDSQTGYIVALYSGIYREKEAVVAGLKARFYKDCYKLKGGFAGFSPKTDSRKTLFISFFRKIIRDGCTASILEQQQSGKDGIPFWMTGI